MDITLDDHPLMPDSIQSMPLNGRSRLFRLSYVSGDTAWVDTLMLGQSGTRSVTVEDVLPGDGSIMAWVWTEDHLGGSAERPILDPNR